MASLLEENVFFMWLSGMSHPDFRTINRFRSERLADGRFESIFHQIVELLHDEENSSEPQEEITKEDLEKRTERIIEKMEKEGVADKKLRKAVTKVKEESLPKLYASL